MLSCDKNLLVSEILTTLCNESKINAVIIEIYVQLCLQIKVLMSSMCSVVIVLFFIRLHMLMNVEMFYFCTPSCSLSVDKVNFSTRQLKTE